MNAGRKEEIHALLALAMAAGLGACATPAGPKSWTGAPPVAGTLREADVPLAGVKVRLVDALERDGSTSPKSVVLETTSDADGRFTVGPIGKRSHAAYIVFSGLAESLSDWGIQFWHNGQWQTGWFSQWGVGYAPRDPVHADCDLASAPADGVILGTPYGTRGAGVCRLALADADGAEARAGTESP